MAEQGDIWSEWLLQRRFGGDRVLMQRALTRHLYPWRDRVLRHAALTDGEVLLDVDCRDGLIAFGALEQAPDARVIFSDVSRTLLEHAQALARRMNLLDRCEFVCAAAEDLSALGDETVDAVTTRAVLIYVSAKPQAFREFYRVLRPGGRLSICEPINRFAYPEPPDRFDGYDVTAVRDLAAKVKAVYDAIQPATDPMLDFDERDLLALAERAGFAEVHLELQADVEPVHEDLSWETSLRRAGNPRIPTVEEAMHQALTAAERERFTARLRPHVENRRGIRRSAIAWLWAVKH